MNAIAVDRRLNFAILLAFGVSLTACRTGTMGDEALLSDETSPFVAKFRATVVKHGDGDTFDVRAEESTENIRRGERVSVRFMNIDTPEKASRNRVGQGRLAEEASRNLATLAPLGTKVRVEALGQRTFGRVLGRVYLEADGTELNIAMVRSGWALPLIFCRPGVVCNRQGIEALGGHLAMAACHEAKAAGLGVHNPQEPLQALPYEFRDESWGQKEVVWVASYRNGDFVDFKDRKLIDPCDQVVFAFDGGNARERPEAQNDDAPGSPKLSEYVRRMLPSGAAGQ